MIDLTVLVLRESEREKEREKERIVFEEFQRNLEAWAKSLH
jgi:hypothetical protein